MLHIHQMRRLSRAVLAMSALCACVAAHAAVPTASPFGIESTGNFEPAAPLKGDGWQRLPASKKGRSLAAVEPARSATSDIAPASVPPAPAASQLAAAPAGIAPVVASAPAAPAAWTVSPADGTFRQLIEAWAPRAGWTVAPWELEKDVPIVGNDSIAGDFKAAVRRVLSSTEMTDYIIKPCFYSNNMVRVVKLTTKCDLTQ